MQYSREQFSTLQDEDTEKLIGKNIKIKMNNGDSIQGNITSLIETSPRLHEMGAKYGSMYAPYKYIGLIIDGKYRLQFDAQIDNLIVDN